MRTLVAALLAVSAAGASASAAPPRLVIPDTSPLTVRGVQFRPGERVTVRLVVRAGPRVTKTVTAGSRGGWTARFAGVTVRCGSYAVRATGARGSIATYTEQLPPCGAAP